MTTIRAERAGDRGAIHAVVDRAFGAEHGVGALVDALRAGPARSSLVGVDDAGTVTGHVMLSRAWVDAEPRLVEVVVLSPLAVDPPHQGRGLGGELVRAALAEAESLGASGVFLEGSPRYYPRFGFVRADTLGFVRPSLRIPQAAFQVVTFAAHEPWMTGQLVYPEAFWAGDAVGLRGDELRAVRAQVGD